MAEEKKVELNIGGMTCAMCVRTVENSLRQLPGISQVSVNLASESAQVVYDPRLVDLDQMKASIDKAGYRFLGSGLEDGREAEADLRREQAKRMRRILAGFGAGLPLMVLMLLKWHFPPTWFLLSLPVAVYLVAPIFRSAAQALRHRNLDMNVMYGLGIGVALLSSLGASTGLLPHGFLFYDTVMLLAAFLTLGRFLEARAKGKTGQAIKKLLGLQPKTALVVRQGREMEIPISDVARGDLVLVKPGQRVPVDGEVRDGESTVDESMITGEPLPVFKKSGSWVIGGTINRNGVLRFTAGKVGQDTMLAQIVRLVRDAQGSKPPVQKLADRIVGWFIPVILVVAVGAFVTWHWLLGQDFLFSLTVLISILVIACPCALGLATPTALVVGIGRGAELGILIKRGDALESSERLSAVLFDKTGTLTLGRPQVTDIFGDELAAEKMLQMAAAVEKNSLHPLGEAVVKRAESQGLELPRVERFDTFAGLGVAGVIDGRRVMVGSLALLAEKKVTGLEHYRKRLDELADQGKSVVLVAVDGRACGGMAVADTLADNSLRAVAEFKKMGLDIALISGDNQRTAAFVGRQLGIKRVIAGVLPGDKAGEVKKLQQAGEKVAFVGDGINDAPALAQADVGIAIGGGTDVAIESGDVVLIRDDPLDAVAAIQLSRKVMRRIRQNLFWAFAYNMALIPLAAGLLFPFFGILLPPEVAGLAMAMSSVTVVSLSLLLKKYTPPVKKNS